jgi:hypothetical protein
MHCKRHGLKTGEMAMAEQVEVVTEKESAMAASGPAYAANRFYIHAVVGSWVRITFAEELFPEQFPVFRTAVVISIEDAAALAKSLGDLVRAPPQIQSDQADTPLVLKNG